MEACTDTLTRSDEGRAGQRIYELAVSFGEEVDPDGGFRTCEKNPGHKMFIPINRLTSPHLPPGHRHKLNWIKHLADLTVKVSVNYVSPHRPARFPLSEFAGNELLSSGSGFVTDITDGEILCPITNCTELPGQHLVPGYITITTAAHVVCDDAEAERTTVEFFYDNPRDKSRVLTCRGFKVGTVNVEGDFCELLCVTHDREVHDMIKWLLSTPFMNAQRRICSTFDRFPCLEGISITSPVNEGRHIRLHYNIGGKWGTNSIVTSIFASVKGRNFFQECGFTGTSLRIDRLGSRTIKVRSCDSEVILNISGTAQLFDDNLGPFLFRDDTLNKQDELICFIEEDRRSIRQLRKQQKSDFNIVIDLIEKCKTGHLDSCCEAETLTATLESVLQRADARRTKLEEYMGIPRDYNQPSFERVRFVERSLELDYHCATDLKTQWESPAAKSEGSDKSLVVHISHPHGQSKMVSLGSLTKCFTAKGYYCPRYTAPTCPSSSGGPTFVLPETDNPSQIYGMPHRSGHDNMLNEGSGWTLYPTSLKYGGSQEHMELSV